MSNLDWETVYWIHQPKNVISSLPSMAFVNAKEFEVEWNDNTFIAYILMTT